MGEKINKNSSLTIRIECKTKENLKKIAKKIGLTMSELVNECLTELIEKKNFNEKYNEKLEKRSIKIINVIIGFIFILIGFCNLTIWGLGGCGYTLSLFIGGLVAFLITFGASGVKELFSKPVKPISNIIKFLLLAIVVSISSAIFLQVIGLKTHGNVILNGGLTPEFFVILPFQMFGEEFLGLFILIVVANLFKGNLIIGNLVSGFYLGLCIILHMVLMELQQLYKF